MIQESGKSSAGKKELLEILFKVAKDKDLLDAFLADLLSPSEYKEVITRWQIVKQLREGKTHREISEDLKTGITTITRGAKTLENPSGGFNRVIAREGK